MKSGKSTSEVSNCRLDQIIADYNHALDAGPAPKQDEFIARYPEFQRELPEFLADVAVSDGTNGIRKSNTAAKMPEKTRLIP